jgi:hypothetical protein
MALQTVHNHLHTIKNIFLNFWKTQFIFSNSKLLSLSHAMHMIALAESFPFNIFQFAFIQDITLLYKYSNTSSIWSKKLQEKQKVLSESETKLTKPREF